MRAVRIGAGRLELVERDPAPLAPGEARIKVRLAGICSTDLELQAGYMGFAGVPGHEFVGEVIEGPAGWRGARVAGEINAACAACATCAAGRPRHCPQRTVLGILGRPGAHADELTLPLANLHRLPDAIGDEAAVFIEPIAAAWHVTEQVNLAGQRVAVLGAGKLGHLIALCARLAGAEVLALGRGARKLELLAARGIATALAAHPPGRGFDVVIDATGGPAGLPLALALVRPAGTVVAKTTSHAPVALDLAPLVVDEVTVVGSRCGRFEPAVRMLAEGQIDPSGLVDHRVALGGAAEAYRLAAEPGTMKVLLEP